MVSAHEMAPYLTHWSLNILSHVLSVLGFMSLVLLLATSTLVLRVSSS